MQFNDDELPRTVFKGDKFVREGEKQALQLHQSIFGLTELESLTQASVQSDHWMSATASWVHANGIQIH